MATDCLHSGDLGAHAAHGAAAPSMGDLIAIVGLDLEHGTCNTQKIRMTSDPANRLISVNDVVCVVSGKAPNKASEWVQELLRNEKEASPFCGRGCHVITPRHVMTWQYPQKREGMI